MCITMSNYVVILIYLNIMDIYKHYAKTCYNCSVKELTDFEKLNSMIRTKNKSVIDALTKDNEIW